MDADWPKPKRGHKDERDGGRDCVELLLLLRSHAVVLEEALLEMGISEAHDNFPDDD